MQVYNIDQLSKELGVTHITLRTWIAQGRVLPDIINGNRKYFLPQTVASLKREVEEYDRPKIKTEDKKGAYSA